MPDKTYDLSGYVTVPERIAKFYELFGQGRLVTDDVTAFEGPDGKPRVMVKALAYRTPDDALPGVGYSWMELPGTTNFTRGSELENTETSAWGRAIAALGILTIGGIATNQEVENKKDDGSRPPKIAPARPPAETFAEAAAESPFQSTVTGKVEFAKSGPADGELRQSPDGSYLVFRFVGPDGKAALPQVAAYGKLAEDLATCRRMAMFLEGLEATVSGVIDRVPFPKSNGTFQRMTLARIETADWTLPSPAALSEPASPDVSTPAPSPEDMAELDAIGETLFGGEPA